MKCTLRKVAEGIVATVDKRPKIGEIGYSLKYNIATKIENEWQESRWNNEDSFKVIASENIDDVKKIKLRINKRYALNNNIESIYKKKLKNAINQKHEYTETETSIIINL